MLKPTFTGHGRRLLRTAALLWAPLLAAGSVFAQEVGTPPPATNPQPQILGPTSVNPAPPPAGPGGVPQGDLFTLGKPLAPVGASLANVGVYLKGFFESTLYGVPSGGVRRGDVVYDEAFYGADFDLQKIAGLKGAVVHFSLDSRFGGFPQGVNNFSGSTVGYLQGAGPDNETRLNELTLDQHLLDDKLRIVVGRQTLANYFATSELYCQFQVGICSNLGPFTWSADSNSPFWPIAVWAGEVSYWPTPNLYARVGASESDPYQYGRAGFPWDAGWGTSHATGVFVPVELGYLSTPEQTRYPAKYDIGFTYDSSDFTDPRYNTAGGNLSRLGGTPASDGAITTIYAQAQKMVWRPDPAKPQGLTLFGGLQVNTSGRALVQSYFMAGAVLHGTFPGRPSDTIGVIGQHYLFNHRQTGHLNDVIAAQGLSGNVSNTEQEIEVNYGLEVAPGIQFKPYTSFTFHPDQNLFDVTPNPRVHYAFAAGVQLSVLLNEATGLPSFFRAN
jgi:porin